MLRFHTICYSTSEDAVVKFFSLGASTVVEQGKLLLVEPPTGVRPSKPAKVLCHFQRTWLVRPLSRATVSLAYLHAPWVLQTGYCLNPNKLDTSVRREFCCLPGNSPFVSHLIICPSQGGQVGSTGLAQPVPILLRGHWWGKPSASLPRGHPQRDSCPAEWHKEQPGELKTQHTSWHLGVSSSVLFKILYDTISYALGFLLSPL